MHLYNMNGLKKLISEQQLSEQVQFFYLFIFIMLFTVFAEAYVFFPSTPTLLDKIQSGLSIFIQSVGIYSAYSVHGGRIGHHFIPKFVAIYVVLSIRFIIFTLLALLGFMPLMWLLSYIISKDYLGNVVNIIYFSYIPIFEICFFWRLVIHIRDIKHIKLES